MRRELILLNQELNTVSVSWKGYIPAVYSYLEDINASVEFVKGAGNRAGLPLTDLEDLCNLFRDVGYSISRDILNLLDDIEKENGEVKKFIAYEYQEKDAIRLADMGSAILGHEMGLGKTVIVLLAIRYLEIKHGVLIVAPSSLLYNWRYEINRIFPKATVAIYGVDEYDQNTQFLIVSYDLAKRNIVELLSYRPEVLIADEAHKIKAIKAGKPGSQRAKAILELSRHSNYVYMLTGTPITGKVKDIFNILQCINALDITYDDFWKFATRYCNAHKRYIGKQWIWDVDGASHQEELRQKLNKYMLRRTRKEVFPDLIKERLAIPVEVYIRDEMIPKRNAFLETLMVARKAIAIAKVAYTVDFAQNIIEQQEQVIIFSSFIAAINSIAAKLKNSVVVKGDMNAEQRQEAVMKFRNKEASVIVLSIECASTGLNLQNASKIIINDLSYLPSTLSQAEDRVCRIGQTKTCLIYYMIARNSVVDSMASSIIDKKLKVINEITDNQQDISNELMTKLIERGEIS